MVVSVKLSNGVIGKMWKFYADDLAKTPEYAVFQAKTSNCSITAYKSGKVVFQGKNAEYEASIWTTGATATKPKAAKEVVTTLKDVKEHVGSDEVGTGDFFGPIVVTSCFVSEDNLEALKELGVTDSKLINDDIIKQIHGAVKKLTTSHTIVLNNEKYNKVILDENMTSIKAKMHNKANFDLLKKLDGNPLVIVDQFTTPKSYFGYLKNEKNVLTDIHLETKAEGKYVAVAAASVIARFKFLKEMDKLEKDYGFTIPKGAGSKVDTLISTLDDRTLNKIGKMNFKNYTKQK